MSPTQVVILMVSFVVVFCAIDVKLAMDKKKGNTYSEIIRNTGNRHPWFRILFNIAVGVLLGHWFW